MKKFILLCIGLLYIGLASAEDNYPSRPINLIIPFGVGGSTDVISRAMAKRLSVILNQPVVPINKPGAAGSIALAEVAKASPDGYTLAMGTGSSLAIGPACTKNSPIDPINDFEHIGLFSAVPSILAVHESMPVKNVHEFITEVKKNPKKYNYGSQYCTINQIVMEEFKYSNKLEIQMIPYKTPAQLLTDSLAGQVDMMYETKTGFGQHLFTGGKLKPIAVSWPSRLSDLPTVPTMLELGIPGANKTTWYGIVAPAGTPSNITKKINLAIHQAVKDPEFLETLKSNGAYVVPILGPAEFKKQLKHEFEGYQTIINTGRISTQ